MRLPEGPETQEKLPAQAQVKGPELRGGSGLEGGGLRPDAPCTLPVHSPSRVQGGSSAAGASQEQEMEKLGPTP